MKQLNDYYIDIAFTELPVENRKILADIEIGLSSQPEFYDSKGEIVSLSENLRLACRVPSFKSKDGVHIIDPIKDAIVGGIKHNINSKFSNLIAISVLDLPETHQPDFYYPSGNKKMAVYVGRDDVLSIDENKTSALTNYRFECISRMSPHLICKAISYNNILDINYREGHMKFKSRHVIDEMIDEMQHETKNTIALREIGEEIIQGQYKLIKALKDQTLPDSALEVHRQLNLFNSFEPLLDEMNNFFAQLKDYQKVFEHFQKNIYANKAKVGLVKVADAYESLNETQQNKLNALTLDKCSTNFMGLLNQLKKDISDQQKQFSLDESRS